MRNYIFLLLILGLLGCSGEDKLAADKTPPLTPKMIAHLGDPGDYRLYSGGIYDYNPTYDLTITDANNGIDAVAGTRAIKLQWEPLVGNDLDYVEIYRYGDYHPPLKIDQITIDEPITEYLDANITAIADDPTSEKWYYYIKLFDTSGNFAVSDTVAYRLLQEALPIYPENFDEFDNSNGLIFSWSATGTSTIYRLLVFTADDDQLFWMPGHDTYYNEEPVMEEAYTGPLMPSGSYYYRIDAFGDTGIGSLSEPSYDFEGSESRYVYFTIR